MHLKDFKSQLAFSETNSLLLHMSTMFFEALFHSLDKQECYLRRMSDRLIQASKPSAEEQNPFDNLKDFSEMSCHDLRFKIKRHSNRQPLAFIS